MRVELAIGLLALVAAVTLAEKTKTGRSSKPSNPDDPQIADGHIPYDPLHPRVDQPSISQPQKGNKGGMKPGAAGLKEEILKIKNSNLSEEEKAARLQALRSHVQGNQMMQNMPPEVRTRHQKFQTALRAIHEDPSLSEEERKQRIADEKASFKSDIAALKEQISPEEINRMRDEQKRTIEGHTAAAMAAKQMGDHKMAREYARRASMAAKGNPQQRKRRDQKQVKRPSLSEPNFF